MSLGGVGIQGVGIVGGVGIQGEVSIPTPNKYCHQKRYSSKQAVHILLECFLVYLVVGCAKDQHIDWIRVFPQFLC